MPVNATERKSIVGVRDLYFALVTQDDDGAYAADTPEYFAPAMSVKVTPASNSQTQYADDGPFDTMTSEGETKIEMDVTAIPMETRATILGKVWDAATGRLMDNGGTPPDIALSFRTVKSNGNYKYLQYLKGKFTAPEQEAASKTDSPDPKATTITFTAVKTIHQFTVGSVTDGFKGVEGDEDSTNFVGTTWFDAVQVPVAGSPGAFTCTPSPADGAAGVSVGVTITLTFSNALASHAEDGIILLRTSTAAPVTCSRTINAARTIVTLDPSGNLTAAAAHMIVVPGVSDIYGQALADTVYDFTTA
jgi:phi13 family phage major tail protein